MAMHFALLVEGDLDESVGRRIVSAAGGTVSVSYGKQGFGYIRRNVDAYSRSSQGMPTLAIVDLMDTRFSCAPAVVDDWLSVHRGSMIFRVAVREIESWILADRGGIAQFLGVKKSQLPHRPEEVDDPKQTLIDAARSSRYDTRRRLLAPRSGSTATEGPAYTSEMSSFVRTKWDLNKACQSSPSLSRCVQAVGRFVESNQE